MGIAPRCKHGNLIFGGGGRLPQRRDLATFRSTKMLAHGESRVKADLGPDGTRSQSDLFSWFFPLAKTMMAS